MPNTLGSAPGTRIATQALSTLLEEFPFRKMITTDFSGEGVLFNQELKIKIPTAFSAADNYHTTNGYVARDVAQEDIALTIDKHVHVTYGFNDQERTSHDLGIFERFGKNAGHAIGFAMMNALLALITEANFEYESQFGAEMTDRKKFLAISKKLNARKIPAMDRFALLNSDAYEALAGDVTLIANAGSPSQTVRSGSIGDVHGIKTLEYSQLPTNGESLLGFVTVPEGLCLATRLPQMPDQKALAGGSVTNVIEPNTQMGIQVREWYDYQKGKNFYTFTSMFGVAVGNPECLERIVIA